MSSGDPGRTIPPHAGTTLFGMELPKPAEDRSGSLVVIAGSAADLGTHVLVGDSVVLGRVDADLTLRDGRISRRHARVWRDEARWLVEDLGSTNGTALNGRAVERPTAIGDGDKLYVGSTVLKFTLVDETEAAYLQRMARLAGSDALTGLHAKHRFDSMLEEALRLARLTGAPLTVLMMDMDGLKAINDTHGHRWGAHTIASVGKLLGRLVEGRGEACRFGGDEFCAFLPGAGAVEAEALAETLRSQVEEASFELDDIAVRATISIGLAERGDRADMQDLVQAADAALYRAKAAGRNRVAR